ncbi:MAG TPA: DUF5658 family protein [Myxococcaceae bacterium]|nr:DUF5658 family protein [Myxococcaceae bacterium]
MAELAWAGAGQAQAVPRATGAGFQAGFAGVAILVFNLLDGLFTLSFLQLGMAEEANPIMRAAYESSPLSFMAFKIGAVHLGVWVLCLHEELRIARYALRFGATLYAGIVLYHLGFLTRLALG